jgi:hypothetical protein
MTLVLGDFGSGSQRSTTSSGAALQDGRGKDGRSSGGSRIPPDTAHLCKTGIKIDVVWGQSPHVVGCGGMAR